MCHILEQKYSIWGFYMKNRSSQIAEEIKEGRRLGRGEDLSFLLEEDLGELCEGADRLRAYFCGEEISLCTIVNGRSGRCSEDCRFCAQSGHYSTGTGEYRFLEPEKLVADARANEAEGIQRYSVVTAGRTLKGNDFEKAKEAYRQLSRKTGLHLCASHGLLEGEAFAELKEAGVERYHANIETSRRYFSSICTTHSFEDKLKCIAEAKKAGLEICSGGILGMGEKWEDRLDMACELSELQVVSIPINILIPIPGTPLGNRETLKREEILRCIALFRYINPEADIRLAGGRMLLADSGREAFVSGANAAITGNMLTTSGNTIRKDRQMLEAMGRVIKRGETDGKEK